MKGIGGGKRFYARYCSHIDLLHLVYLFELDLQLHTFSEPDYDSILIVCSLSFDPSAMASPGQLKSNKTLHAGLVASYVLQV